MNTKKISRFTLIACIIAITISLAFTLFSNIYELPVSELVLGTNGVAQIEQSHSYTLSKLESVEDINAEFAAVLDPENPHHAEEILEDAKAFINNPSLYNINRFLSHYNDESVVGTFNTVMIIVIGIFIVIALVTIIAGHFKRTVFFVFSYILATAFSLLFAGIIAFLLISAAYITHTVIIIKIKKSEKAAISQPAQD